MRILAARRSRVVAARDAILSEDGLSEEQRRLLGAVDPRIHPDDVMLRGDPGHYLRVGLSAIECIDRAAPAAKVESVLDFASGYGRVLRFLPIRFQGAELTACDVQRRAVRFCAQRFGARPVKVPPDVTGLDLQRQFDLIWCGSLVTHLDEAGTRALLRAFAASLSPSGTAIVTTHGRSVVGAPGATFAELSAPDRERIASGFEERGFGYAPYPGQPIYGLSATSVDWMREAAADAGLRLGWHAERGWAGHQDAFAMSPAT